MYLSSDVLNLHTPRREVPRYLADGLSHGRARGFEWNAMHVMACLSFLSGTISELLHKVFNQRTGCRTTSQWHTSTPLSVLFHHANTCRRVIRLLEMPIERCPLGALTQQNGSTGQEWPSGQLYARSYRVSGQP